jgi:uncharacterized membrane protein YbhN (UPF0104 family)
MVAPRTWLALKIVLSLALLFVAVSLVDFRRFAEVLTRINLLWLICAIVVWVGYQAANALLVVALLDGKTTLAKVWRVNLVSAYFGLFLPGDAVAGMASRIRYLGLPSWQDVAVLTLAERLLTLGVASGLACLVYWASSFERVLGALPVAAAFAVLIACVAGLQTLRSPRLRDWAARLLRRWTAQARIVEFSTPWPKTIAIATGVWVLSGLTAYFVLRALSAEVTPVDAFLFSYIATLVQLVPFFFAGIGIRDVSAIAVLGLIGVSMEIALAASLVGLLLLVASGIVGGILQIHEEKARAP